MEGVRGGLGGTLGSCWAPGGPKVRFLMILGSILGSILGVFWALVWCFFDVFLRSLFERLFGDFLEVLGSILEAFVSTF